MLRRWPDLFFSQPYFAHHLASFRRRKIFYAFRDEITLEEQVLVVEIYQEHRAR